MYCDKANFLNRIALALRDSSIRSATLVVTLICALIAALVTFVTQRQVMQMQERFNNEVKEKELRENFLDIYQTLTVSLYLLMKQFDYFSRSASLKNISDNSFRSFESELMTLIAKVRVRLYVFKGESLFDEIHRLLKKMETCQKELTILVGNDRVQRI